jgi:hypothetical protein
MSSTKANKTKNKVRNSTDVLAVVGLCLSFGPMLPLYCPESAPGERCCNRRIIRWMPIRI